MSQVKEKKIEIQSSLKECSDQTTKEHLLAKRKNLTELESLLRISKDGWINKQRLVNKFKEYQSKLYGIERIDTICKGIRKTTIIKLKICMRKVLKSLRRQYPPEKSFKNFDEDMTQLCYRFENFWCQTNPKSARPHAEMKIVNKILPVIKSRILETSKELQDLEDQIALQELHLLPEELKPDELRELQKSMAVQIVHKSSLYIGISYLCCGDCHEIFEDIYHSGNFNQIIFHSLGTHRKLFEKWMMPPNIQGLQSKTDKLNATGPECLKNYLLKTNDNKMEITVSLNSIQSVEENL